MMKTLLSIILLASVTFANAQTNLVVNGDMEKWDSWSGELTEWARLYTAQIEHSKDAQSGESSVLLRTTDASKGVNYIQSTDMELQSGTVYQCSFYYKVLSGTFSKLEYMMNGIYGAGKTWVVTDLPIGDWKKVSFDYTPAESSEFHVKFSVNGKAGSEILLDNVSLTLKSNTSINDANADQEFSVYPNPTTDYLYMTNANGVSAVTINAINGASSKQVQLSADGRIDVSGFPAGMYILNSKNEGKSYSSKFIKN